VEPALTQPDSTFFGGSALGRASPYIGSNPFVRSATRQRGSGASGSGFSSFPQEGCFLRRGRSGSDLPCHRAECSIWYMDRLAVTALLRRLHEAQNIFYGGGGEGELRQLLTEDIVWTVPGDNAIAGIYRGVGEVLAYFRRRRDLADATFRLQQQDLLSGDGDHVAALVDGTATIGGKEARWSTVGLYKIREDRIAACWLLPLDADEFNSVWSM